MIKALARLPPVYQSLRALVAEPLVEKGKARGRLRRVAVAEARLAWVWELVSEVARELVPVSKSPRVQAP